MSVNIDETAERLKSEGLYEIFNLIGVWSFRVEALTSLPLKIKVERGPGKDELYFADINYLPRFGGFHPHTQPSAQEAFDDTLKRFLASLRGHQELKFEDFELNESF